MNISLLWRNIDAATTSRSPRPSTRPLTAKAMKPRPLEPLRPLRAGARFPTSSPTRELLARDQVQRASPRVFACTSRLPRHAESWRAACLVVSTACFVLNPIPTGEEYVNEAVPHHAGRCPAHHPTRSQVCVLAPSSAWWVQR